MATRTTHTRFYYPSVCEDCKRIPLVHIDYESRFNVGYDWEDSLTYTTCPVCLVKGKIVSFMYRTKDLVVRTVKYVLPVFFELVFKAKTPVKRAWEIARNFFR